MSSHAVGRPLRFRLPVFTLVALVVLLLLIGGRLEASEISSSKSGDLWVCGPANAPPCRAPSPDAATVVAGARGYPIAFFWSGDADLIIAARLPGRLRVGGEMNGDLRPVAGSPYQAIAIRMMHRDIEPMEFSLSADGKPLVQQRWPTRPTTSELRAGRLTQHELATPDGNGRRTISVYIPDGYASDPRRTAVLVADGQTLISYAKVVDAAIVAGRLPKVLLVGVWHDPQQRGAEYVRGQDPRRFEEHARFVEQVVVPFATRNLHAPTAWFIAGMSDGAAWALATQGANPSRYTGTIALSPVYGPITAMPGVGASGRIFVGWGLDEHRPPQIVKSLKTPTRGAVVCDASLPGGHTTETWAPLFILGLTWLASSGSACF